MHQKVLEDPKIDELSKVFYEAVEPPPDLRVWEWADKFRVLASEASSEPGPWRTSRFPYLREIMDVLSPQCATEEVILMSAAQVGKTECCLNLKGSTIHYHPRPMLYIQKTVDAVMKYSAQRLSKSLLNTPEVADKIAPMKSRDDSNTKLLKNFPGGLLVLGGANSAASLRSMPICILMLDECDSYELGIQEEGDPIELAIRRTANFPGRKIFYLTTPNVKETSRIEPLFESSDQRFYYVPCPFCKKKQRIIWENIKYSTFGDHELIKDSIYLKCVHCGKRIREHHKTYMLENGEWIPEKPGREIVGFHINALYSPLGFFSWKKAVLLWLKYRRTLNTETLRVFVNTVLGETYSETGKEVDFSTLESRKEQYPADIPKDGLVLVCGADVQDDRIEAEVVAFGVEQESWSIEYVRFMGDTAYAFVWEQFDKFLQKQYKHESGVLLNIAVTAVDSGYRAREVYNFCKTREVRRIFPIKGQDGWGRGLINRPLKRHKDGVWLFNVFDDEVKTRVYSQLKTEKPGPTYCHFPDKPEYDSNYFRMLTSERLLRKRISGQYKLKWELPAGRRNEALDCRKYAIAALNILNPNFEQIQSSGGPLVFNTRRVLKKRRVVSKGLEN